MNCLSRLIDCELVFNLTLIIYGHLHINWYTLFLITNKRPSLKKLNDIENSLYSSFPDLFYKCN